MATANPPEPWYRALIRRRAQILLVSVSTIGAMTGLGLVVFLRISNWSELIGLGLILVLASVLERNGSQLFSQTRASVSAAAIMGSGFLYGVPRAVPLPPRVQHVGTGLRRRRLGDRLPPGRRRAPGCRHRGSSTWRSSGR